MLYYIRAVDLDTASVFGQLILAASDPAAQAA